MTSQPQQTKMRIGILQTGQNRAELAEFDDYPVLFDRLLNAADRAQTNWCEMKTYRVLDGEFPEEITACDGYIVTGSAAGVYEPHDWIAPLMRFIQECHKADIALVGICFGHQAIAKALGGDVVKWPNGWGVGVREMTIADAAEFIDTPRDRFSLIYFHQDQVTTLPDGARQLATSAFCENGGFTIGTTVLCLQGHPEFNAGYSAALLAAIEDKVGKDRTADAKASLDQPTDAQLIARWINRFFTAAHKARPQNQIKAGQARIPA